ncbi:EF-hand domain-containing family member B-like [Tubulanus polymorphus]|uniref:EF-hand domain-containing family member B-like n=1 Tax=Tubulanus polymorphus TaxID=672921 RepID=UPI003DA4200A
MVSTAVQPSNSSTLPWVMPNINTKSIYAGRFRDRNPDVSAAGKLTATGDSAQLCIEKHSQTKRPPTPEAVRRFHASLQPEASKARVFYSKAYDPHRQWAAAMTHGLSIQPSVTAAELLNPHPNTRFKQRILDKKESYYLSHQQPLGKSHDQRPGLPYRINRNPHIITYGIPTEKGGSAGEMVNPDKTYEEVDREDFIGHDLYTRSHADYLVGERVCRSYTSPSFNPRSCFGIPTPHSNDGRHVRSNLRWLTDIQAQKAAPIVSKRLDNFRERTQPQLGKVHDPIKDTLKVGPDHTFGILLKPDDYGAGDLIHMRSAGAYLRGKERQRGVLAAIRQHLKKANYHNFHDLLAAFKFYDKDGSGKIDINELREACVQFSLPVEPELLEQLMDFCDTNNNGFIDYIEFANFLNWKDKLPTGFENQVIRPHTTGNLIEKHDITPKSPASAESTPRRIQKQIDQAIGEHRTSNQMINAVVGGVSTRDYRTYGVPTIRADLPAPRIKRVEDRKNYGDESDAHGLMNPSYFSLRGVYEKDFLKPRGYDEMKYIFTNIGVRMTGEVFDQLWKTAEKRHPKGYVSVELFRNVLDELQASQVEDKVYS